MDAGCRSKTVVQEHMRERAGGTRGQGLAWSQGQRQVGCRLERVDKLEPELVSHKQGQVLAADMMVQEHRS